MYLLNKEAPVLSKQILLFVHMLAQYRLECAPILEQLYGSEKQTRSGSCFP